MFLNLSFECIFKQMKTKIRLSLLFPDVIVSDLLRGALENVRLLTVTIFLVLTDLPMNCVSVC